MNREWSGVLGMVGDLGAVAASSIDHYELIPDNLIISGHSTCCDIIVRPFAEGYLVAIYSLDYNIRN